MSRTSKFRAALLTSGALAVAGITSPALAQASGATPDEVDEVVVTGSKLQNKLAIDVRKSSLQVVDAVTSDDVGRLPDFNVGEALQRLPGVSIQNDQAEARFVTVRALNANYNFTTVDGVSVAVPDRNGRRVFMDVMPASLAERIDVYKTFTPNLEGAAIGGIIDLRTSSAFDHGRNHLSLSAEIGRYDNNKGYNGSGPSGDADILYSTRFGAEDNFGLVLFANYYRRDSYIPQFESGGTNYFYTAAGTNAGQPGANTGVYPGTGFAVPGERRWYWYHNDRTRYGGGAKLEYRTDGGDEFFLRGFWNTATDDEVRQTDLLSHSGGGQLTGQTATSGSLTGATGLAVSQNLGQFDFERTVWALTAGGDHEISDEGSLTWRLNYSGSQFRNPENFAEWRMSGNAAAFAYERQGDVYTFTPLNPSAFSNYAAYQPLRYELDDRGLDEDIYEAKADYTRALPVLGDGWSLGVGAGYRRVERTFNEDRDRYLPNAGNTYTLAAANVLRNDQCLQPPGALPGQCLVVIDPRRAQENFAKHLAANPAQWRLDTMANEDNVLDYSIDETVWSAYGLLRYSNEQTNVVFGLRYEDTSTEGRGRRRQGAVFSDVENEGGYADILPSINIGRTVGEQFKVRAAYSRSLGRAPFNALAPTGESIVIDGARITVTQSNPNLRPRRSDNFDLAVDWYFDQGQGVLSASVFHKRVKDEIFTTTESRPIELDGQTVTADVTQPTNAGRPVHIWGVEFNAVKNFDFLPAPLDGLGVAANLTLLKTDFAQAMTDGSFVELRTMIGQPDTAYNLALFYDKGRISARLAYNYIGLKLSERVNTTTAYRNRYDTEEKTLDFKVRYRINDHFAATFNAANITGSGRGEAFGWNQELPMVKADIGAAYFVGFSANF